jgi:hypothetical protein
MQASITRPSNDLAIYSKPAHGLTIPVGDVLMGAYIQAGTGDMLPADATDATKQKAIFVTEIIDVNTVRLQTTGFWTYPAHGYTVGEYYYITDAGDGGFSTTPGTLNDIGFFVFDANILILLDNRKL